LLIWALRPSSPYPNGDAGLVIVSERIAADALGASLVVSIQTYTSSGASLVIAN
jgi:hypothetical protein